MPCYHPLTGFYAREVNDTGKRSLVFSADKALLEVPVQVPCGRCVGCRLDRSLSWALRCVNEASLYDENCFITLTFSDDNLPPACPVCHTLAGSLCVCQFQKFLKRLRKYISPRKVRYFHCGEYGELFSRPHHHACLFGYDFPDKVLFSNRRGFKLYTSEILSDLWEYGFSTIGDVTFDSCAYVARYILKKWSKGFNEFDDAGLPKEGRKDLYESMRGLSVSDRQALHYQGRLPEYVTMSRNPGLGTEWLARFGSDLYPSGFAVTPDGRKVKPPKFYDNKYDVDNPGMLAIIKAKRVERALANPKSRFRLDVEEKVKLSRINQLTRGYENGH